VIKHDKLTSKVSKENLIQFPRARGGRGSGRGVGGSGGDGREMVKPRGLDTLGWVS
jgi:hypothetical protein